MGRLADLRTYVNHELEQLPDPNTRTNTEQKEYEKDLKEVQDQ